MDTLNTVMAVIVVLGGLLCARAFLPHVSVFGPRPVDNLARGLVLCAMGSFPRITYWDVAWSVFGLASPLGLATNLIFNIVLLSGVYFILRARWLTIPEAERHKYNVFTAAWYPQNIVPRLRQKE